MNAPSDETITAYYRDRNRGGWATLQEEAMTTSPDAIHETALLTVSQWQRTAQDARDAQFYHRAQRIAADLWDARRDLEPHEQQFLTLVREIGCDYVRVCGDAKRAFGPDSKTALAVEFTARQRRQERYAGALVKYEADCG